MRKYLFLSMMLLVSCQNLAVERTPNSFDFEFNPNKNCSEISTTLNELNHHQDYKYDTNELSKWLRPSSDKVTSVFIVAHGLNLRPSKMDALSKILTAKGAEVLRTSLAGHRGSKKEGLFNTHRGWRNEFQAHYCLALARSTELGVPLYFLGFSLGALIGTDFLNTQVNHQVEKMVLIAPATDVHWYSKIPGKLGWLGGKVSLPSKNLKEYRSQPSTSLASYRSMKNAQKSLEEVNLPSLNIPTLIFVDPDDELVSIKNISERIKKQKLSNWEVKTISNKGSTLKKTYHHLVVDKQSMGPHQWEIVKKDIINHFQLKR